MKAQQDLIAKIKREVAQKKKSREALLDQLAIVDAEIDLITGLIVPLDADALAATGAINETVDPIQAAYDARIAAGCRSDLIWAEGPSPEIFIAIAGVVPYVVVKNQQTAEFTPYYGLKYYQKPLDRDYGATIVSEFVGSVEDGKPVIAIDPEEGVPPEIQIGDTITDSLDLPQIFSLGDLPEVVSIGTTSAVGFLTSLTGGITTGSNTFYNFGAGSLSMVEVGMVLSLPGILTERTLVTGFSTGNWSIDYINESGILTSTTLNVPTISLDKPALDYTQEANFSVGIITNYSALFLSTYASSTQNNLDFIALRVTADIDAGFDYTSNPNAPLKIGTIGSGNLGVGGSVYLDNSGDPNETKTWDPNKSYVDPKTKDIVKPEPKVGAGRVDYNIGTFQWPTVTTTTEIGSLVEYAPEGTTLYVSAGSTGATMTYASMPPGGFPPNCGEFDAAIAAAEAANQSAISANEPIAQKNITMSSALRKEREKKQLYAWSLLQGSSKLLEEIKEGEILISQLDAFDFD